MANKRGKAVDTTCLSLDHAEQRGFLHRDYLAHCLRWSHVTKYLLQGRRYQTHHVLDVGCGKEAPLPKLMYSSRMTHTKGSYTGIDYGKVEWPDTIAKTGKFKMTLYSKQDFVKTKLHRKTFDTVTCFEMVEHVEPWHAYQTLKKIREVLTKDGRAFISTPCYDEKTGAADNHVNEMTYPGLLALIELSGLEVDEVHGTFASQKDYKKLMSPAQTEVFEQLSSYYDSNVLACIMAPMFPHNSRNCIWKLKRGSHKILFPTPKEMKEELSQTYNSNSKHWPAHIKKIVADAKKGR